MRIPQADIVKISPFCPANLPKVLLGLVYQQSLWNQNHTIQLILEFDTELEEFKYIIDEIQKPLPTILGINYRMQTMILAIIGNFSQFDSPNMILAYAGISSSTCQSAQLAT